MEARCGGFSLGESAWRAHASFAAHREGRDHLQSTTVQQSSAFHSLLPRPQAFRCPCCFIVLAPQGSAASSGQPDCRRCCLPLLSQLSQVKGLLVFSATQVPCRSWSSFDLHNVMRRLTDVECLGSRG